MTQNQTTLRHAPTTLRIAPPAGPDIEILTIRARRVCALVPGNDWDPLDRRIRLLRRRVEVARRSPTAIVRPHGRPVVPESAIRR